MSELNENTLGLAQGHRTCAGCGIPLVIRPVLSVIGKNTIVVQATGCGEVVTTQYPETSWEVPWIHGNFENASAIASGIAHALKSLGKKDKINVLAVGGDGATADIGTGLISGAFERGDPIIYLCYDNEAYENTGFQRSSQSPLGAATSTSPPGSHSYGKQEPKKNMVMFAIAHRIPYAAQSSIAFQEDLKSKVKKAKENTPAYLHVYSSCPLGWKFPTELSVEIAKKAVECGIWPLYEVENGVLKISVRPKFIPVEEYLFAQGRFKHLKKHPEIVEQIKQNIKKTWAFLNDNEGRRLYPEK